jgi:hypothetical protein
MLRLSIPDYVFDDICRFISENYSNNTSNSLLIAHAFCLKYTEYEKTVGIPAIKQVIEDGIKCGLF